MQSDPRLTPSNSTATRPSGLDALLERIYSYHDEAKPPKDVSGEIWAAPTQLPAGASRPADYFLHYFQSQGLGPTHNECVTASTVMAMNIMEDRLTDPLHFAADLRIEDYIRELEAQGLAGWRFRFPTRSPLPGMMPPSGARRAMRLHAARLKARTGRRYTAETRVHMSVDSLVRALAAGKVVLLHGAWQKRLSDAQDKHLALLGGMPHTMLLAGYEPAADNWSLLNPAEPWLTRRDTPYHPHLFRMNTPQLMDFWGRRFLFYPPRFAATLLAEAP